jgi:hypothetical protein
MKFSSLKNISILTVSSSIPQLLSFLLSWLSVRTLNVRELSMLGSMYALLAICITLATSVRVVATNLTSFDFNHTDVKNQAWSAGARILTMTTIICAPILTFALHIPFKNVAVMYLILLQLFYISAMEGVVLGKSKFRQFSKIILLLNSLQIASAIAFATLFKTAFAAILGLLFGVSMSSLIMKVYEKKILFTPQKKVKNPGITMNSLLKYSSSFVAFQILASSDLLISRWFLTLENSGSYVAGNIVTKIVLYASSPIIYFVLPKFQKIEKLKYLFYSLIWVITMSLVMITLLKKFPNKIAEVALGGSFQQVSPLLWKFGVLGMLLGLNQIFLYYGVLHKTVFTQLIIWSSLGVFLLLGYKGLLLNISLILDAALIVQFCILFLFLIGSFNAFRIKRLKGLLLNN